MTEQRRVGRRARLFLGGLLIAIVSFAAGTRSDLIMAQVGSLFGLRTATGSLDLSTVQRVYRELKAHYDGKLDEQALTRGAARGMVAATGDPHTAYMDPDEAKEFEKSLSGNIGGGIGAEIAKRHNVPTIIRPLKNSPAEKVGIKAGDVIVKVNDTVVTDMPVDQVVQRIRGDVGTTVKLVLSRGGERKDVTVTREKVVAPAAEWKIDGEIGILTVSRFNDDTGKQARQAAEEFRSAGVKKVILDLRGNPGGTVAAAQALAGLWLNHEVVMTQRRGEQVISTEKSTGQPLLGDIKTVVLINGGSASASEIVAGALKDYGKATLVGEKTYGKGSVQRPIDLADGSVLKVTEARWYTPHGKNIDKSGIEPDVKVEVTAGAADNGRDLQLEKAKSV
ncbi:S41 family peptidase [Candidatus Saccharibacteria bacterium oral taxon 488]|nr:S41 family peptidase [Candidatus Saccharibacteria bacterium oral taxon 488]